jgi:hypothetical protein
MINPTPNEQLSQQGKRRKSVFAMQYWVLACFDPQSLKRSDISGVTRAVWHQILLITSMCDRKKAAALCDNATTQCL